MYLDKIHKIEKRIILAELVFISFAFVYLFVSSAPTQLYPISGMAISDNNFVFEIKNGEKVVISNSPEFKNTIVLEEGSEATLPPGEYYWKVIGKLRESSVKKFYIKDVVGLDLQELSDKENKLRNSGTLDVNVTKDDITTGILGVGESIILEKDNSTYEGRKA